jgi:catechol 2,3-dioxygenase-like lactoylglutathione lyase family enzyme
MTIEIDHISLSVLDYEKAKAFYTAALAPLRVGVLMEFPMDNGSKVAGLGADGQAVLWISGGEKATPRVHIALRAESRGQVDAFHAAAIAAGGLDNGGPGIREMYAPTYYAAYILDPEGHNIEAVTHAPVAAKAARKPAKMVAAQPAKKVAKKAAAKRAAARKKPVAKKAKKGKKKK